MTAALLLALVLQTPEPTIDDRIAAFVKGDEAARAELVKLGVYAIRPLQKAREKAPEEIDRLILELKKAGAAPGNRFDVPFKGPRSTSTRLDQQTLNAMSWGAIPFFLDDIDAKLIKSNRVIVEGATGSLDMAEQICRRTGLDFGFFHNSIVFAHPERLWPTLPVPHKGELKEPALGRAKELINQLNHDLMDAREAATLELLKLGRGIAPLLEEGLKRNEPEISSRCRGLLDLMFPLPAAFGPPAAARQTLDDEGRKVLQQLGSSRINLKVDDMSIARVLEIVSASQSIKCVLQADVKPRTLSFFVKDMAALDLLCLITQSKDLDFTIGPAGVVVDERAAIEKVLPRGK